MKTKPHTRQALAALTALALLALTGCSDVQTLRITNTSAVPMAFTQAAGDDDLKAATGTLQPGQSMTVTIRENESITLPGALTIKLLGD